MRVVAKDGNLTNPVADKFADDLINEIQGMSEDAKIDYIEELKERLDDIHPLAEQPVNRVRWVDIDEVQANDYNPNSVAGNEMHLLYTSILHDGYTQPVVTFGMNQLVST